MAEPVRPSDYPNFSTYPAEPPVGRRNASGLPEGSYAAEVRERYEGAAAAEGRSIMDRARNLLNGENLQTMKRRLQLVSSRATERLRSGSNDAMRGLSQARERGVNVVRQYPLQTLAAVGAAAFLIGAALRWARSGEPRYAGYGSGTVSAGAYDRTLGADYGRADEL